MAWQGMAWRGKARQGGAWQGRVIYLWHGKARSGSAWQGKSRLGGARHGFFILGVGWHGLVRQGEARWGLAGLFYSRQGLLNHFAVASRHGLVGLALVRQRSAWQGLWLGVVLVGRGSAMSGNAGLGEATNMIYRSLAGQCMARLGPAGRGV